MFGIIRPCRHRLTEGLRTSWMAHLCGLCLALRDDHGQLARTVTNYDGLVISALVEAQSATAGGRRIAGPCPLRGMRTAEISEGAGARLAASVSLVLASAKVRDHVDDGDGLFKRRAVAGVARKVATRWARQGEATGDRIGFSTAVLLDAVGRQGELESQLSTGASVLLATEPTETATAAAFGHTAVLAGRPGNVAPLTEAGRLFGRVAHLLDAVEDLAEDAVLGAWNPLAATGTSLDEARRLCDDAVLGVRLALDEAEFTDQALVHVLLVHELQAAVSRTFCHAGGPGPHDPRRGQPYAGAGQPPPYQPPHGQQPPLGQQHPQGPPPPHHGHHDHGGDDRGSRCLCWRWPKLSRPPESRGFLNGCGAFLYQCCSCQFCCRDPYPGPWSGKPHSTCDCDCTCECCNCCDC